jgi:hypothetical protein
MLVNDKLVYNEIGHLIRSDMSSIWLYAFQNTLKLGPNHELSKMSQKWFLMKIDFQEEL